MCVVLFNTFIFMSRLKKLYATVIGSLIWVMRGTVYDSLPVWLETIILSLAFPPVYSFLNGQNFKTNLFTIWFTQMASKVEISG